MPIAPSSKGAAETLPERNGSGQEPHMTAADQSILRQMTCGSAVSYSAAPLVQDRLMSEAKFHRRGGLPACFQTTE
jgi:hypothetical protein